MAQCAVHLLGWFARGDSLVLALSLPLVTACGARFPAREQIIFITRSPSLFITLVVQGLTLAPIGRWLRLGANQEDVAEERTHRLAAAEAGLKSSEQPSIASSPYPRSSATSSSGTASARRGGLRPRRSRDGSRRMSPHEHFAVAPSHQAAVIDERRAEEYRRVRSAMLDSEQQAILDLR